MSSIPRSKRSDQEVKATPRIHELHGHAHAVAGAPDAAFQDRSHTSRLAISPISTVLPLKENDDHRAATCRPSIWLNRVEEFLGETVTEEFVPRPVAVVDERKDGDARPFAVARGCGR